MKIGIIGGTGRMGKMLVAEVDHHSMVSLSGVTVQSSSPLCGASIHKVLPTVSSEVVITDDMQAVIEESDAVIEFTRPETTMLVAKSCADYQTILVSGTTGLSVEQKDALEQYAQQTTIIWSSNMSIGVNLLNNLVKQVAERLDIHFDIEIVEMHHNEKVDAPSGTALTLGEYAAQGRKVSLEEVQTKTRDGIIGPRPVGEIGFSTIRGGDVIGDHQVIFAGAGERIELSHKASNRTIYAKGAVQACLWAKEQNMGLYSMNDVLGF